MFSRKKPGVLQYKRRTLTGLSIGSWKKQPDQTLRKIPFESIVNRLTVDIPRISDVHPPLR